MKQFALGLSLSVAFIIGCVSSQYVLPDAEAQHKGSYHCLRTDAENLKSMNTYINKVASLGGQLVSLTAYHEPQGLGADAIAIACVRY